MLSLKHYVANDYKNIKRYIFDYYNIPDSVRLYIYDFIDIWKYIYDNVVFDIDMGIYTTQIFYNIKKKNLPKLAAFSIPNELRDNIVAYRDIYIPLSSLLQMNSICLDTMQKMIISKFNRLYNEDVLEKLRYFDLLKDKLKNEIITKKEYDKLITNILINYHIDSKDAHTLQYVCLTEKYNLSKDKIDNLILRSNSDSMAVCNNCDLRYNISQRLSDRVNKNIPILLKEPYKQCQCKLCK